MKFLRRGPEWTRRQYGWFLSALWLDSAAWLATAVWTAYFWDGGSWRWLIGAILIMGTPPGGLFRSYTAYIEWYPTHTVDITTVRSGAAGSEYEAKSVQQVAPQADRDEP